MKLSQIAFGQAIRFMKISPSAGQTIYGKTLSAAFEEKYGFLEGPKVVSDFDTNKGVTFLHGFFKGTIVIEKAVIYNDGMIVEAVPIRLRHTPTTSRDAITILPAAAMRQKPTRENGTVSQRPGIYGFSERSLWNLDLLPAIFLPAPLGVIVESSRNPLMTPK